MLGRKETENMMKVQADTPQKYIYLSIMAFWLSGALIAGYIVAYSNGIPIQADLLLALMASYQVGISLIVYQSNCRNVGLSLLLSILTLCVPLVIGQSWLFPFMALVFTVVAWWRRCDIASSMGRVRLSDFAALVLASCTFAVVTLTGWHDANLFFRWDIMAWNSVQIDPLFHSAITAMIKNFGVSSTGLDGLVTLNYHVFSHVIRAAISFGTGLPVVSSYGAMQMFISGPLLLMAIVAAAETFRPSARARYFILRIVVLFVALYSIQLWPAFSKFALWDSYATSDSYAISLILMLATLSAIRIEGESIRLLVLALLVWLTSASKISTGTICAAIVIAHLALYETSARTKRILAGSCTVVGWGVLLYFERPHTQFSQVLSLINTGAILNYGLVAIVAVAALASIFIVLQHQKALRKYALLAGGICSISFLLYLWLHPHVLFVSGIQKLYFLRTYVRLPSDSGTSEFWLTLGNFTVIHFLFTWLLVVASANLYFWNRDKAKYLAAPLLYSLCALIISWLVLFFSQLGGGAEYYFTNVAMFVALPYLLTIASIQNIGESPAKGIAINALPLILLTGSLLGVLTLNHDKSLVNLLNAVRSRTETVDRPFAQIFSYLEEIRNDLSTKDLAVYVAKEEIHATLDDCSLLPFVIPAVTERSGLLSLPDPLQCAITNWGYSSYSQEAFVMSGQARVPHEALLKLAVKDGFNGYVDVRKNGWTVYRSQSDPVR